jgi:hypothetical protein
MALTAPSYYTNYTFGASGIGNQSVLAHEFGHAVSLLLPEHETGVSSACGSRSYKVREACASEFEGRVNEDLKGKQPTNPQQAVPPNDD